MKRIMERIIFILILFLSFTEIAMDNEEEYETLQGPDCQPVKVLVKLPIPELAGYTFEPTHTFVTRCMGVNDEKKVCVHTETKREIWKIVKVQKMADKKNFIYVSWLSHEACTYRPGRNCSLEDATECSRNAYTYYDEIKCNCTHFLDIHEDIADVPAAEFETVVSFIPTPEVIISNGTIPEGTDTLSEGTGTLPEGTGTIPEGTDNNDVSRFTYTQDPATAMENSQMAMPPSNTDENHSKILNMINYTFVGNIGTTINSLIDVHNSSIGTNDQLTSNTIKDTPINNIGTTSDLMYDTPVIKLDTNDHLTSNSINGILIGDIGTTNNILIDTSINKFITNDQLSSDILNDNFICIIVKNKKNICISSVQNLALVVLAVLLLLFLLFLGLYFFFIKKRHDTQ